MRRRKQEAKCIFKSIRAVTVQDAAAGTRDSQAGLELAVVRGSPLIPDPPRFPMCWDYRQASAAGLYNAWDQTQFHVF